MPKRCPKCDRLMPNQARTCPHCGLPLEPRDLSFEEMFGPPKLLQGRYVVKRRLSPGQLAAAEKRIAEQSRKAAR